MLCVGRQDSVACLCANRQGGARDMVDINATLIAQIINFLILLFILKKFAYGPLMQVMKEREDKISSSLEAADNDK